MTVPTRPLYTPNLQPGEAERTAIIDLNALEHNTRVLKDMIGERKLIAVVKADAYGHGAYPVARSVLEAGADILGVVHVTEALELRSEGITAPIIAWLHTPQTDFDEALEADIILGASGWDLEAIAEAANRTKKRARVHLKVDTGLGRNGSTFEDWPALVARERSETARQIARLNEFVTVARSAGLTPELVHLANSPGTITGASPLYNTNEAVLADAVRCGIALYGLSSLAGVSSKDLNLRPVMTLGTHVCNVKEVPAGQGVSYGLRYSTDKPTTLALIPLGYADGVPRIAEGAPVRIYPRADAANPVEPRTYRVVGRIAMDQLVVDLEEPGLADPARGVLGGSAVLFGSGDNPPVEEWAAAAQTINYEIVTRISPRVIRIYRGGAWVEREVDGLHALGSLFGLDDEQTPETV